MKRMLGQTLTQADAAAIAPVGAVGMDLTSLPGMVGARWFLATITVTVAASDVFVWGALAQGAPEDETDDIWGLHQDPYRAPLGKIGTLLPVGVYHVLLEGLGLYPRVYFQKSAGTVDVRLTEVHEAGRGN